MFQSIVDLMLTTTKLSMSFGSCTMEKPVTVDRFYTLSALYFSITGGLNMVRSLGINGINDLTWRPVRFGIYLELHPRKIQRYKEPLSWPPWWLVETHNYLTVFTTVTAIGDWSYPQTSLTVFTPCTSHPRQIWLPVDPIYTPHRLQPYSFH